MNVSGMAIGVSEELIRVPRGIVYYHKGMVSLLRHRGDLEGPSGHHGDYGWL